MLHRAAVRACPHGSRMCVIASQLSASRCQPHVRTCATIGDRANAWPRRRLSDWVRPNHTLACNTFPRGRGSLAYASEPRGWSMRSNFGRLRVKVGRFRPRVGPIGTSSTGTPRLGWRRVRRGVMWRGMFRQLPAPPAARQGGTFGASLGIPRCRARGALVRLPAAQL